MHPFGLIFSKHDFTFYQWNFLGHYTKNITVFSVASRPRIQATKHRLLNPMHSLDPTDHVLPVGLGGGGCLLGVPDGLHLGHVGTVLGAG